MCAWRRYLGIFYMQCKFVGYWKWNIKQDRRSIANGVYRMSEKTNNDRNNYNKDIWSLGNIISSGDPLFCVTNNNHFLFNQTSLLNNIASSTELFVIFMEHISGPHIYSAPIEDVSFARGTVWNKEVAFSWEKKWKEESSQERAAAGLLACWMERSWCWGHSQCPDQVGPVS